MNMFNETITLYHYDNGKYTRRVIENVFWDNVKRSNVLKTGISESDTCTIIIPIEEHIDFTKSKDLIVKGNIGYEIDNTSQVTIANGIKYLKSNYETVTVSIVDEKLFGGLQHIELSCK